MNKPKFNEAQIIAILKQEESGTSIEELCHTYKISTATFYKWRAKYSDSATPTIHRLKKIENDNRKLNKLYVELQLKVQLIETVLKKKWPH